MRCSRAAVVLGLLLPCLAHATLLIKSDLPTLIRHADAIVIANVVEVRTVVRDEFPWTIVTITIEKNIKSSLKGTLSFQIPGGVKNINGKLLVTRLEGVPEFRPIQKGVFFLRGRPPEYLQLADWRDGFREIEIQKGREMVLTASPVPLQQYLRSIEAYLK